MPRRPAGPARDRSVIETVQTRDGVPIATLHLPRPDGSRDLAIVVGHGFSGSLSKPAVQAVADGLAKYAGVLLFDFRGHGASGGRSTVGDLEVYDVEAVVREAKRLGYARVATCGWSMGGSVVIRHAALMGGVDAVVSVSAVSRWFVRETPAMRRLHWVVMTRAGRVVARVLLKLRLADGWGEVHPEPPVDVVGQVAPTPLLIVHGTDDHYFGPHHAQALADAAGDPHELWIVDGFGHAETAADPALLGRIGQWTRARVGLPGAPADVSVEVG